MPLYIIILHCVRSVSRTSRLALQSLRQKRADLFSFYLEECAQGLPVVQSHILLAALVCLKKESHTFSHPHWCSSTSQGAGGVWMQKKCHEIVFPPSLWRAMTGTNGKLIAGGSKSLTLYCLLISHWSTSVSFHLHAFRLFQWKGHLGANNFSVNWAICLVLKGPTVSALI